MAHKLVVCIGNPGRGDDGVAHAVSAALWERLPEEVRLLDAPALDVVMAEELCDARLVVFVDAERRLEPPVRVDEVHAQPHGEFGHDLRPGHLLDVAYALYAARPKAWLVTLAAPEMEHGRDMSPAAEAAVAPGVEAVLELLS